VYFGDGRTFRKNIATILIIEEEAKNGKTLRSFGFLLGFVFDPSDGCDVFLRNVERSPNYMAL
jgi:hypothetical protein